MMIWRRSFKVVNRESKRFMNDPKKKRRIAGNKFLLRHPLETCGENDFYEEVWGKIIEKISFRDPFVLANVIMLEGKKAFNISRDLSDRATLRELFACFLIFNSDHCTFQQVPAPISRMSRCSLPRAFSTTQWSLIEIIRLRPSREWKHIGYGD